MSDFRFDKIFLEPFIAVNEDDGEDAVSYTHLTLPTILLV